MKTIIGGDYSNLIDTIDILYDLDNEEAIKLLSTIANLFYEVELGRRPSASTYNREIKYKELDIKITLEARK